MATLLLILSAREWMMSKSKLDSIFEMSKMWTRLSPPITKALLLLLFLLAYLPRPVLAGQSLNLTTSTGRTGQFTIPNALPFTALADTRVELRVHSFVVPTGPSERR